MPDKPLSTRERERVREILRQHPDLAGEALSNRGARKGGEARARKLSPRKRSQIARRAGKARWGLGPNETRPKRGKTDAA